jgi:hypothetical protein
MHTFPRHPWKIAKPSQHPDYSFVLCVLWVCSLSGLHNQMRLTVRNKTHCCCLTCVRAAERATYSQTNKTAVSLGLKIAQMQCKN